ncbi:MAG TPA: CoA transferase [Terriglobales bacterium]|nr:CoA transferase [Terriglobales bacterium]
MSDLPLRGLRLLAFTQLGAGPYAMTILGDLGAEIIKVEDPTVGGDEARSVPPHASAGDSPYFQSLNRNSKSLTLNLRTAAGRELFHRLVKTVDAVYANPRGDLPAKLGLDYDHLKHVNPKIVCCALSGFGRNGPRATDPGYDFLIQGLAGWMSLTGEPDSPPGRCGVSIVDFSGGLMSAVALLIGIVKAQRTGVGCDIDVSLFDTALSMLNYLAAWNLNYGHQLKRLPNSAHQTLVPSQNFRTRDGYIVIMCMKEKFWQRMAELMELSELLADPRFLTFQDRFQHREEFIAIVQQRMLAKSTDEWLAIMKGQVPCAPVYTVEEALEDAQVVARQMVIEVDHPRFGRLRQVGCPIKVDQLAPNYRPASPLGSDTAELLQQLLSMTSEEIAQLRSEQAI